MKEFMMACVSIAKSNNTVDTNVRKLNKYDTCHEIYQRLLSPSPSISTCDIDLNSLLSAIVAHAPIEAAMPKTQPRYRHRDNGDGGGKA